MNNELLKLESKELRITSMELVDIINQFREGEFEILKEKGLNKKDKYTELRHDSFMTKIKKELETLKTLGLGGDQNILESSYINSQNKKQPCYTLNRDGMLQMLNSESAIVRAKTINYINKLEQQLNGKANLLLSIYEGGQNAILASKKLTELEVAEAIKPLNDKIDKQKNEIEEKEIVISGLVDEIDVAEKRQIINRVVKKAGKNYQERWSALYLEFESKYHMDIKRRMNNYNECNSPKIKTKIDYIDKFLNKIPQLYEMCCKLFYEDVEKLKQELYCVRE